MRVVAKFQLMTHAEPFNAKAATEGAVQAWLKSKFASVEGERAQFRRDARAAEIIREEEEAEGASLKQITITEPVEGGRLKTEIEFLTERNSFHFRCTQLLASDVGLSAPEIDLRSPRFIREIIDCGPEWYVSDQNERVFNKCFLVGASQIQQFKSLLVSEVRRLPLVVVSSLRDETLAKDLHEKISADTAGIAHTCKLTSDAAWALTEQLGKQWSCYNGAVRLFWPFRAKKPDFRAHPLWTYDTLMKGMESESQARDKFRKDIVYELLEASTFVIDQPVFQAFRNKKLTTLIERQKKAAEKAGDYKELAELYASENKNLKQQITDKDNTILQLDSEIQSLTIELRSRPAHGKQTDASDAPPESVADAVDIARRRHASVLLFGDDIDDHIKTLNPTAGPPEKVLRYLDALASLSKTLMSEPNLGKTIPVWLKEKGIDCSVESETIRRSKTESKRREFRIKDKKVPLDLHLKPTDGVSPDLCVRIYFDTAKETPRVRIGYIGRHLS